MVPTSAISISIKKLENELGCPLFTRSANKICLNSNGRIFMETVSSALSMIEKAKERVSPIDENLSESIRLLIRCERSLAHRTILDFKQKHPRVSFHLTHSYIQHNILDYDIVIDELSSEYKSFIPKALISEKIRIAAAKSNPLCNKELCLYDLRYQPFILLNTGGSLNRITKEYCHKAGFEPNVVIESDDPMYIRRFVKADFGISLYPEKSWDELDQDICFLNVIDFDYTRTTYAYLNNQKMLSPIVRNFFDYL